MKLNKAQIKRIERAVKHGSIATYKRTKSQQNGSQELREPISAHIVRG